MDNDSETTCWTLIQGAAAGEARDRERFALLYEPVVRAYLFSPRTFVRYQTSELLASASPEEFEKLFDRFKKLGGFRELEKSTLQTNMFFSILGSTSITGRYVARVEFDSGPARIQIIAVKKGGEWKINYFKINSPALMAQSPGQNE